MDWKELLQHPENQQLLFASAEGRAANQVEALAAERVASVVNLIQRDRERVMRELALGGNSDQKSGEPLPLLSAKIATELWGLWTKEEKAGLGLHEGYTVHVPHTWFSLHVPVEVIDDPRYTWIIDPISHGIHAPYLVIAPGSPFQISYAGQRIDEGPEISWETTLTSDNSPPNREE